MILTFRYRVKDSTVAKHLARHAWACNQVWNFCVETQHEAERRRPGNVVSNTSWPTAFDLSVLCPGAAKLLGTHSDTIRAICHQFVASRDQHKSCPGFRASFGSKRALGWVPFAGRTVCVSNAQVIYLKRKFRFWKSREIEGEPRAGAFVQDARGRWYVTFQCEQLYSLRRGNGRIGIDLGLKALAACSDGTVIPAVQYFRRYEAALGAAQRARNRRQVRTIYAKIANSRRHHLHEWSAQIARENKLIVVGNASAAQLAKTMMAKSVMDASWGILKTQLRYKASRHGATFIEVDERFTSATCSSCGARSGPQGIAGLRIRSWECGCGAVHDRDINAAKNILKIGLERQAPGEEAA